MVGRDFFYFMDSEDKIVFYKGFEGIVEKENEKLLILYEWLYLNIENVDYGVGMVFFDF